MRLPFNASVVNVAASSSVVGERVPCHPAVQLTDAQSGKIHFSPACFGFTRHNTAAGQWPRPSAPSRTRGRRCITRTGYSAQNTRRGGECAAFWRAGDGAKRAYSTLQAAEQSWQMNFFPGGNPQSQSRCTIRRRQPLSSGPVTGCGTRHAHEFLLIPNRRIGGRAVATHVLLLETGQRVGRRQGQATPTRPTGGTSLFICIIYHRTRYSLPGRSVIHNHSLVIPTNLLYRSCS